MKPRLANCRKAWRKRVLYLVLMLATGCMIAMQSPINAALSRETGAVEASLVSFATGAAVLALAVFMFGKGDLGKAFDAPIWQWSGGLLGALMVLSAIVCVPRIGVLSTALAMIIGNLAMAALIDNFGWFGAPVTVFGLRRLLGFCLVLGGLYFIFRQ